jgi:hypothetical protein
VGQSFEGSTVKDAATHRRILGILLEAQRRDSTGFGVHRSVMKRELGISEKSMDYHMAHLAQRGLVRLREVPNYLWLWAKVTAFGIDALKDWGEQTSSFDQPDSLEAQGDLGESGEASRIRRLADAFHQARDLAKATGGLSEEKENRVAQNLDLLEEELTTKEPDVGEIQKTWKWLKKNADWVEPVLRQVVLEGVERAFE